MDFSTDVLSFEQLLQDQAPQMRTFHQAAEARVESRGSSRIIAEHGERQGWAAEDGNFHVPDYTPLETAGNDGMYMFPASRIKTNRACIRCRKMKLSCVLERPCPRCVKAGCPGACCDAPSDRKRKRKGDKDKPSAPGSELSLSNNSLPPAGPLLPSASQHRSPRARSISTPAAPSLSSLTQTLEDIGSPMQFPSGVLSTPLHGDDEHEQRNVHPRLSVNGTPLSSPAPDGAATVATTTTTAISGSDESDWLDTRSPEEIEEERNYSPLYERSSMNPFPEFLQSAARSFSSSEGSTVQSMFGALKAVKEQFQHGIQPVAKGLFNWVAQTIMSPTRNAQLTLEEGLYLYSELEQVVTDPTAAVTSSHTEELNRQFSGLEMCGDDAPVGIMASTLNPVASDRVYVNKKCAALIGLPKDYLALRFVGGDSLWAEICDQSTVDAMFANFLQCANQREPEMTNRITWKLTNITCTMHSHIKYTEDGTPFYLVSYISPV